MGSITQELGWDHHTQILPITVDETEYTLTAIAQKRGMVVFECAATGVSDESIPDYAIRRKIQKQVAKSVHEHFIIYTDAEKTTQVWQWVKREQRKPDACREHRYNSNEQSGGSLIQKLRAIAFTLEEEEDLSLPDVTGGTRTPPRLLESHHGGNNPRSHVRLWCVPLCRSQHPRTAL